MQRNLIKPKLTIMIKYPQLFVLLLFTPLLHFGQTNESDNQKLRLQIKNDEPYPIEVALPDNSEVLLSLNYDGVLHLGRDLKRKESAKDGYLLYVQKGIRSERVKVDIAEKSGWADYVFLDNYDLLPITELAKYIDENKHLPGVPTSEEVMQNGLDLAESNRMLLEKVEELSLYIIELNARIEALENK